jgi:hypothetical protein
VGLELGVGKRELLNDYYLDEIYEIIREHNDIHGGADADETEYAGAGEFFGF